MNDNFSVGGRLRELRKQRAMSQEQVANIAEITPAYFGQVERGEKNITVFTLERACMALDVSLAEFFNPIGEADKSIDDVSMEILGQLSDKSKAEKQAILRMVKLAFQIQDIE